MSLPYTSPEFEPPIFEVPKSHVDEASVLEDFQSIAQEHAQLLQQRRELETEIFVIERRLIVARNLCYMYGIERPPEKPTSLPEPARSTPPALTLLTPPPSE